MDEARLAREGADLHSEQFVVVGVGFRKLLDRPVELNALARRQDDGRGGRTALVGPHVVHVVACGDGGLQHDAVGVAAERLHAAFPRDALRGGQRGRQQRRESQQAVA